MIEADNVMALAALTLLGVGWISLIVQYAVGTFVGIVLGFTAMVPFLLVYFCYARPRWHRAIREVCDFYGVDRSEWGWVPLRSVKRFDAWRAKLPPDKQQHA